jgi:hypothetical protein
MPVRQLKKQRQTKMRGVNLHAIKSCALVLILLAANVFAQTPTPASDADKKAEAASPVAAKNTDVKNTETKANTNQKTEANSTQPAKKMVQDASITLQTTITGNQEQPRVLYILPWQSPMAANVDFESLDNEQKAVFGHVEREELRRELEASDEAK